MDPSKMKLPELLLDAPPLPGSNSPMPYPEPERTGVRVRTAPYRKPGGQNEYMPRQHFHLRGATQLPRLSSRPGFQSET